jgi:cell division protein FtsW
VTIADADGAVRMGREPRDATAGRVVRGPQREHHDPDWLIMLIVVGLAAVGILMVYSSTAVRYALDPDGDLLRALVPELLWAVLGVAAMLLFWRFDYRWLRLVSVPGYLVALGLLVIVLSPAPLGPIKALESGGSSRWLAIGGLPQMHPAELAKLAMVVYLAHWFARRGHAASSLTTGTIPFLIVAGLVIGLVALEPDLGTTGVIALTAVTMFYVAGANLLHLAALAPLGLAGLIGYVITNPYQLSRVTTFLDPWAQATADGYHTVQGLLALGLGGLFGAGLGQSRVPGGLRLPNADNDFVFAMVGQEFGLVGGAVVIALFLLLAWRGVRVALAAPDTFGGLLAMGITAMLTFQAFINIGVVVQLLPITGITLPFVSSGGTSIVVSFAAVGILLSVSRETLARGSMDDADPGRRRRDGRAHPSGAGRPSVTRGAAA